MTEGGREGEREGKRERERARDRERDREIERENLRCGSRVLIGTGHSGIPRPFWETRKGVFAFSGRPFNG